MNRNAMDWNTWKPKERAVLCFILRGNEILLIRKKRGLGAGKINGPGGRLEPDETLEQAAIRETQEEICVTPKQLDLRGELFFQFLDGYSLHCSVFTAAYSGETPQETAEADPFWVDWNCIPFHDMWADDAHWLPGMLAEGKFRGYFLFENDKMLSHDVIWPISPQKFYFLNCL